MATIGITAVIAKTKGVEFMASRIAVRNPATHTMKLTKNRLEREIGRGLSKIENRFVHGLRNGPAKTRTTLEPNAGQIGCNCGRKLLPPMEEYALVVVKQSRLFSALTILMGGGAFTDERESKDIIPVLGSKGMRGRLASKCFAITAIRPNISMVNVHTWCTDTEEKVFELAAWTYRPPEQRG